MDIFDFDYNFQENSQGGGNDLLLLEEKWLGESLVGYLVESQTQDWLISLVFVSRETPLKFIIRKLEKTPSQVKMEQYRLLSSKTSKLLKPFYKGSLN
ncbi:MULTISPECIES: hypothetical protein [Arcicella]|uniref:Uncharacterized protein n=1 Tax=Arcicella aquatica TaxID=217141 RepID=A0ABU5QLV1_9BACT|nr:MULTISPECIES: hypothetical protein [Arcicella]MDR6561181.1 hypothetical protein [Arcicella sp. BE51]MDR6811065.1 hypothetical protein [Arcicella sp. BE140]MDR6822415.1 hypothetical protein [Arcicella sp. BE139]MEA5258047.1 hypothetical protein [Arcicella aquatica]